MGSVFLLCQTSASLMGHEDCFLPMVRAGTCRLYIFLQPHEIALRRHSPVPELKESAMCNMGS